MDRSRKYLSAIPFSCAQFKISTFFFRQSIAVSQNFKFASVIDRLELAFIPISSSIKSHFLSSYVTKSRSSISWIRFDILFHSWNMSILANILSFGYHKAKKVARNVFQLQGNHTIDIILFWIIGICYLWGVGADKDARFSASSENRKIVDVTIRKSFLFTFRGRQSQTFL